MILNNNIYRQWIGLCTLVLFGLSMISIAHAAPRKILNARWAQNWVHPGSTTTISSDGRTLTTKLPKSDSINSNYRANFSVNMSMGGNSLPVYITATSHQGMMNCPTKTPHPNKPVLEVYCTALTSNNNDGLQRLTKDTKITIKISTPGGGFRKLYWRFEPKPEPLPISCIWNFSIAHPGINQHFPAKTKIPVRTQIQQGSDQVDFMGLFLNNQLIRIDNTYPYEWGYAASDFRLRSLQPGTYTIKIKAKDNCGNTKEKTRVFYIDA